MKSDKNKSDIKYKHTHTKTHTQFFKNFFKIIFINIKYIGQGF